MIDAYKHTCMQHTLKSNFAFHSDIHFNIKQSQFYPQSVQRSINDLTILLQRNLRK